MEEDFITRPLKISRNHDKDELGFKGEDIKIITFVVIFFGACWLLHNKLCRKE